MGEAKSFPDDERQPTSTQRDKKADTMADPSNGGDEGESNDKSNFEEYAQFLSLFREAAGRPSSSPIPATPAASSSINGSSRFESLGLVGYGSFGVVYRVRDTVLGVERAIKIPRNDPPPNAKTLATFLNEARIGSRIHHQNIVQVYWADEVDSLPLIVMEYCPDGSLATWLKTWSKDEPLPARWVAELVESIAAGLQEAHNKNILHRDLKPGNIMLVQQAGDHNGLPRFIPKVGDFGLAKALETNDDRSQSTSPIGTLAYMSPEQLAPGAKATTAADVYALGVILYELLTRRLPYEGVSGAQLVSRIQDLSPPVRPRVLRSMDLPKDLETICLVCLRRDPEARYPSADSLRQDLQNFRLGKPIKRRHYSVIRRLLHWSRARPSQLLSVLLTILFITTVIASWSIYIAQRIGVERESASRADTARKLEEASSQLRLHDDIASIHNADTQMHLSNFSPAHAFLSQVNTNRLIHGFPFRFVANKTKPDMEFLFRLDAKPTNAAFSRAGDKIAWADQAGNIYVLTGLKHKRLLLSDPSVQPIHSLVFSNKGELLAIHRGDELLLVELATGTSLPIPYTQDPKSRPIFLDSDRTLAVSAPLKQRVGTLQLIDLNHTTSPSLDRKLTYRDCFATSPDGRYIAYGAATGNDVEFFEMRSTRTGVRLKETDGQILNMAFSPNSLRLAVSLNEPRRVTMFNIAEGNPRLDYVSTSKCFSNTDRELFSFSPDSAAWFFLNCANEIIAEFSVHHGDELANRGEHSRLQYRTYNDKWLSPQTFAQSKTTLCAFDRSGSILMAWDSNPPALCGNLIRDEPIPQQEKPVAGIPCFCPNGGDDTLVYFSETNIIRWHLRPGIPRPDVIDGDSEEWVWSVAASSDGTSFASGGEGAKLNIWDLATGEQTHTLTGHNASVGAIDYSPDGRFIASGSFENNNNLKLWNTTTGHFIRDFVGHTDKVRSVHFDPSGRYLASASWDRSVRVWNVETGKCVNVLDGMDSKAMNARYFPDGKRILVCNQYAFIWDPSTGTQIPLLPREKHDASAIAVGPDGNTVAVGDDQGNIVLWDADSREIINTIGGAPGECHALTFTPDGQTLASASINGQIELWDVPKATLLTYLKGHKNWANSLVFTHDAKALLSGSHDGTIRIWRASR